LCPINDRGFFYEWQKSNHSSLEFGCEKQRTSTIWYPMGPFAFYKPTIPTECKVMTYSYNIKNINGSDYTRS